MKMEAQFSPKRWYPVNYTASQPSSNGILRVVREQICQLPLLDMFLLLRLFHDASSVELHCKVATDDVIEQ